MTDVAHKIIELNFQLPFAFTRETALPQLLSELASPDTSARANALSVFSHWLEHRYFSASELNRLLEKSLDGMCYKLGNSGDDSVFVRSYTVLLLLELLHYNLKSTIFDASHLELIYGAVTDTFLGERDYRAVVAGKGWAYAIPHIGDNFLKLSQTEGLEPFHGEMLETIGRKLCSTGTHIFRYLEDERLAYVVLSILKQGIVNLGSFENWLIELTKLPDDDRSYGAIVELSDEQHAAYYNVRTFLRSLDFQLRFRKNLPAHTKAFSNSLEEAVKRLDPGFYTNFAA